jgi:virulence factor
MTTRIAIIGLGSIAQKAYLPILATREGIEPLFCSRARGTVETLQAKYRVTRGTTRLEELLDWQPKAAFVLTATSAHYDIASQLLAAGVDVFLEKPAALTSQQARHLSQQAEAGQRVLMVGFNRRYAPLHRIARDIWGQRRVDIAVMQKHRSSGFHPNLVAHYTEEMIHIIDMLRFFCGEAEATLTSYQENGKLSWGASTVSLQQGGYGTVLASMQAGHWKEQYVLHGEGASLYVDAFANVKLISGGEQRVWEETYASSWKTTLEGRGFYGEIVHFMDCVEQRATPQTSGWEAVKTQQLAEAMVALAKPTQANPSV